MSKAITLIISTCLFFPVYAQTGNPSEDQQTKKHVQEIEKTIETKLKNQGLSDAEIREKLKLQSENINKHAAEVRDLVKEQVKKDHPTFSDAEINQETDVVITEGLQEGIQSFGFGQVRVKPNR